MSRWFPLGKEGAKNAYESKEKCESAEGQICYSIGNDEPGDFDVVDGVAVLNQGRKDARLAAETLEANLQTRMSKFQKALRVIALMGLRNEAKGLNQSQIEQVLTTYQPIMLALLSMSMVTARAMIVAVTPDGTLITQTDKDEILAEIDA